MIELLGHLHPVILHLPIGILLAALFLQWLSRREKYKGLKQGVPLLLLVGSITAIISCITGYLLSISDDYDQSLVNWHMWMAIGVVLVSLVLYSKEVNPAVSVSKKWLSVSLLVLVLATGHFGGSLTHGSDYLSSPFSKLFSDDTTVTTAIKPLANVQEAMAYAQVIQPILETKCYSCHNENKQKGKLRMDDINLLMKGGKHGPVIDFESPDSSEIIKRLLLPSDNDHHMPPKEKPQPTESQVALIHWWISNKADFNKKVKELNQPDQIKPVLLALQKPIEVKKQMVELPAKPVEKADDKIIAQLVEKGIMVLPVAQNTNYLSITISDTPKIGTDIMKLISKLSDQLIFLKITHTSIEDDAYSMIGKLNRLTRLNLSYTNATDDALKNVSSLKNLQQLNLVGTKVTSKGLEKLSDLKELKILFLYQTRISPAEYASIKSVFPEADIDTGNYTVPFLPTDTTLVKAPVVK